MNDFDAWQKILLEWKQVNQMKRYNQELYDQLGGTKMYVLRYAERYFCTTQQGCTIQDDRQYSGYNQQS